MFELDLSWSELGELPRAAVFQEAVPEPPARAVPTARTAPRPSARALGHRL